MNSLLPFCVFCDSAGLFAVLSHCADDCLLRQIGVYLCRNVSGLHIVLTLLTDDQQANGFDQLGRLYVARATLHARKAGQALVQRFGRHQLIDHAAFDHRHELMRMVFHLVKRRTGAGYKTDKC